MNYGLVNGVIKDLVQVAPKQPLIPNLGGTNVHSFLYDPETKALTVRFHSGAVYQYFNVPANKIKEFNAASSKGSYLLNEIKPHHGSTKLKDK